MEKTKLKKVPLDEKETKDVYLSLDEIELKKDALKFNMAQARKAIKLNLPTRTAEREVRSMEEDMKRLEFNEKYFKKLSREKAKEVVDND